MDGLAALVDLFGQVTPVQAEPVAVAQHLVVGVDRGDRVFEVHDRGDRRLQDDVLDAGLVGLADRRLRVDQDLDVQAVVDQQHRPTGGAELTGIAEELLRAGQIDGPVGGRDLQVAVLDAEPGDVGPRPGRQRDRLVEECARVGDDLVAADPVVAGALVGAVALRDDVGAVQRVVQRAPPGVGGVQRKARVEDGHHQLRPGRRGDLVVDTGGGDGEVSGFRLQITDLGEELAVPLGVERLDDVLAVVLVDLRLQVIAALQQVLVLRLQVGDDLVHTGPEAVGVYVGAGQSFVVDEVVQHLGDAQVPHRHAISHLFLRTYLSKSRLSLPASRLPTRNRQPAAAGHIASAAQPATARRGLRWPSGNARTRRDRPRPRRQSACTRNH